MRIVLFAATLSTALAPGLGRADEFTDVVEGALESYRAGDTAAAREDLDYAVKLLAAAKAKGLAALLPEPAKGWTREEGEDQTSAMAMFGGGVTASAVYRRGDEDFTLTLIADAPMVASVAAMLGGMAALPGAGVRRIARQTFAVSDGQIQGVVDGKVLVSAEGSATVDDMAETIGRLDFDAIKAF